MRLGARRRGGALRLGLCAWPALLALAGSACSGEVATPPNGAGVAQLTIEAFAYSPVNLEVPAGGSVLVWNKDAVQHTVTSASAPGTFTFGSVNGVEFDTRPFTGWTDFTISADAPVGTVVPYFCRMHGSAMLNEGTITVVAPPAASEDEVFFGGGVRE